MTKFCCLAVLASLIAVPAFSQTDDVKSNVLKHLKTSRDFTVKVAEAMPESDYDFKLTPPQMSFAQQMVHLASGLDYFLAAFSGEKPNPPKPASLHKADVVTFIKAQYDKAIDTVSKLTPGADFEDLQEPRGRGDWCRSSARPARSLHSSPRVRRNVFESERNYSARVRILAGGPNPNEVPT